MSIGIVCERRSESKEILTEALRLAGVEVVAPEEAAGLVHWGTGTTGDDRPHLNAAAVSFNKYQQLQVLSQHGVKVPPFSKALAQLTFPMLARKTSHTRGKDIVPLLGPGPLADSMAVERSFFVQYVPHESEWRVWVYRRKALALYKKNLIHPEVTTRFGAHYSQGWRFVFEPMLEHLALPAIRAVAVLGLDFGAVDLVSMGTEATVLEVNTAPGVEGLRHGVSKLAQKIAKWEKMGFPRRGNGV